MAYLMDDNAMRICIRPRPWHPEKEVPFLQQHDDTPIFLGHGGFAAPPKKAAPGGAIREVIEVIDNRQIDFDKPEPSSGPARRAGSNGRRYKDRRYVFDRVFQKDATQEEVYDQTAKPLLEGVLKGYNATVFAYGATGCGKTHTISGTESDPGIIVRTMSDLFQRIQESDAEYETHLELSMIELYNEQIRDLLSENFPTMPVGGLKLLENERERVTIADVTIKAPKSVDEVMELVMMGNQRRSTSFTTANSVSSRSHAVLQINVTRSARRANVDVENDHAMMDTSCATLSIVDLAGSERAAATANMGARMKEGANINKSLLALSSCISALCAAQRARSRPHVPFRNSKLTRLLKFSLGGNCRTVMIVCISPSSRDIEDTSNTLLWANRAKEVKTTVTRNVGGQELATRKYLQRIAELSALVDDLKQQVGSRDSEIKALKAGHQAESTIKVTDALAPLVPKVDDALPIIQEGAVLRAKWCVADLAKSRLESRRDELDDDDDAVDLEREREFCDSLISSYDTAFLSNRTQLSKVEREREATNSVTALLKQVEDKGRDSSLDDISRRNLSLVVDQQRSRVQSAIAQAREDGFHAFAAANQDVLARYAIACVRYQARLEKVEGELRSVIETGDKAVLQNVLGALQAASERSKSDLTHLARSMTHSESSHKPLLASPTVKKMKAGYHSKARALGLGSPKRPIRPRVASAKQTRFPDQTGEGELRQIREFRVRTSSSFEVSRIDIDPKDVDTQGEWEELKEAAEQKDNSTNAPAPLPLSALSSLRITSSPAPFKFRPMPMAPPPPPTFARVGSPDLDNMPEWKKNRILLGKLNGSSGQPPAAPSLVPTTSAGETSVDTSVSMADVSSSSDSSVLMPSKAIPIGMGRPRPPSRSSLVPLGNSRQLPARSLTSSSLMKPTAASARRATDKSGGNTSPAEDAPKAVRRLSIRHERQRPHKSAVKFYSKTSGLNQSKSGIPSPVSPNGSPRGTSVVTSVGLGKPWRPSNLASNLSANDSMNMSLSGRSATLDVSHTLRPVRSSMTLSASTAAQPQLRPRSSMAHIGNLQPGGNAPPPWR